MGLAPNSRGPVRNLSGILNWRRWLVRAHASVALTPGRSPKRALGVEGQHAALGLQRMRGDDQVVSPPG